MQGSVEPQIAAPHAVDNVTDISVLAGTPVDVVFLVLHQVTCVE